MNKLTIAAAVCAALCVLPAQARKKPEPSPAKPTPFASTYRAIASAPVLIQNATVLTGTGTRLDNADVLMQDGKIQAVGKALSAPGNAKVINATGKWITPGIIDVHSHLGVYASPGIQATSDGNEATNAVTAHVWAEHSVWPQDAGFAKALAGGVTSMQILPGSANLVGGRSVILKNVAATTFQAMKFPDAPYGIKMACGENPKRVYGEKGGPSTRMGNMAGYRAAFIGAEAYRRKWDAYEKGGRHGDAPDQDLANDTLAGVLRGDITVNIHCYRADEMAAMIDLSKEFGFQISSFHHGVEAYKVADLLAREKICGALWADWWGFKLEAFDGIEENIALVDRAKGGCAIVHSDSAEGIQRLNQEAAKVIASSARVDIAIAPEHAIKWLTSNAAKALRIEKQTGSLEAGKMADVVVWNGTPFSSFAKAEQVFIDGALLYDRSNKALQPKVDFLIGQEGQP
ncbi:MAG: amidohydrolase [Arenimonas sp.]|nr:amidohydrolase [Arenimonas sp.]